MRVLVFGASITQGFWDSQGGWVQRLRAHYDTKQIKNLTQDNPTIFNLGISADTTEDILRRFENETKARARKDMAFILTAGVNDAAIVAGQERSTTQKYKAQIEELIDKAKRYSPMVLCVGIGPCEERLTDPVPKYWHDDLRYTNEKLFKFEKIMRQVCAEEDIPHVAIFETMQAEIAKGRELLADGLHPNDAGHQLIFELVRPKLDELLNT